MIFVMVTMAIDDCHHPDPAAESSGCHVSYLSNIAMSPCFIVKTPVLSKVGKPLGLCR